jgi:hypothetical protein
MASPKQQAAEAATEVAKEVGREGIGALEREAQRRREDPCTEVARLEHKLSRLPRWRWLARAITRNQLGRARDLCSARRRMEGHR